MEKLEEAARKELVLSHLIVVDRGGFKELLFNECAMLNMFRKGTEWQTEQSPWISVEQAFPPLGVNVIHTNIDTGRFYCGQVNNVGTVALGWTPLGEVIVTHYMMIPPLTFDKKLEANKDVL